MRRARQLRRLLYRASVWSHARHLLALGRAVVAAGLRDDIANQAAVIAYYTLFSLFPLLLGILALLSPLLGAAHTREYLVARALGYFPGAEAFLEQTLADIVAARGRAGLLSALGLLFAGRGVFAAIAQGVGRAFPAAPSRSLLQQTLLAVVMTLGVVGLLLFSAGLTVGLRLARKPAAALAGAHADLVEGLFGVAGALLPLLLTTLALFLLYRYVPPAAIPCRAAAISAGLTALLFEAAKWLFVWYAAVLGRFNLVYGSLGAVIGLLTWAYVAGLLLLLGAEVCGVLSAGAGPAADLTRPGRPDRWPPTRRPVR